MTNYRIDGPFIVYPDGTRLRAIAGGGDGGSKSTTTQTVSRAIAAPSLQETAAQRQVEAQLAAYEQGIQQLQASQAYRNALGISDNATQWLADYTSGRTPLVDQFTQDLVNQAYLYPRERGQRDIRSAMEQEAQRRGLALTDTPVGNTWGQNLADFTANLGSSQAKALLDLGQQRYSNMQNVAPFGLNLQQQVGQNQLGLSQAANQFRENLANFRLNAAPTTVTQVGRQTQPFSQTFGQTMTGAGQGLYGLGAGLNAVQRWLPSGTTPTTPSTQRAQPIQPNNVQVPPFSWFGNR